MDTQPLKPCLLMLHGFLGCGSDWDTLTPELEPHFRLLTPDLPGHGMTPLDVQFDDRAESQLGGNGSSPFDKVCLVLLDWLDKHDVTEFHLLGYSLGGRLALHLAHMAPSRLLSLNLESCHPGLVSGGDKTERLAADSRWAEQLASKPLPAFLDVWYRQGVFAHLDDDARQALVARRSGQHKEANRQALVQMYLATSLANQDDLRAVPAALPCPVNLYVGEWDHKFTGLANQWQQHQSGIHLFTIQGAGHNCHAEQPGRFAHSLLQGIFHHSSMGQSHV
ncbi:2-succinyl-6-hydroxy-2,4-cyclohexadiene-1-carboxylate synthase [Shewanella litorisediminis]|uniref:Putative 2-succinyl-6-hydroxy-2,4-cyclohexadiene-1-carboxylate synthase n=1 Tax=Shewanella litorisediminis TaxID=1173586 RepID=A0ABX7G3E6_9GAMM|nr:2-succinyl-6-hydroxy-2,4-cyclohexadiene-1-carboxylate synthase [Shewanella litorisediminis]MCL2917198.1 2-succinyl-6-hydroxy-2,4-cyclohexadiene-1-carboxylate synthase [Shewanella litorisediminis]QRH01673.1 2-succinyl-6-hydroxy-2,4-cyclohexadiene-1-carboxylate synthase [Shewanella litorisediminis]